MHEIARYAYESTEKGTGSRPFFANGGPLPRQNR